MGLPVPAGGYWGRVQNAKSGGGIAEGIEGNNNRAVSYQRSYMQIYQVVLFSLGQSIFTRSRMAALGGLSELPTRPALRACVPATHALILSKPDATGRALIPRLQMPTARRLSSNLRVLSCPGMPS